MAPHVAANVLKGLWETAELNAGTVRTQARSACVFTQLVTCPNLRSEEKRKKKKPYYRFPDRLTFRFRLTAP